MSCIANDWILGTVMCDARDVEGSGLIEVDRGVRHDVVVDMCEIE